MALLPKAPGLRIENVASDAYTVSLTIASTSPRPRWVWVCPVSTDCSPLMQIETHGEVRGGGEVDQLGLLAPGELSHKLGFPSKEGIITGYLRFWLCLANPETP